MTHYDFIVIGQGLAGTTLAWHLLWAGARVLVLDREQPVTASRVAAGLITPITGQRLVTTWKWDSLWPAACEFYERVAAQTGGRFLHRRRMLRLFQDASESQAFAARCDHSHGALVSRPVPLLDSSQFSTAHGGFEMANAGQLDVPAYLDASRNHFMERQAYGCLNVTPDRDVLLHDQGVAVPVAEATAGRIIFCEGIAGHKNDWFAQVQFDAAKGEVLTLHIPGLQERRVVHRGVWLARKSDEVYLAGATYDRDNLDWTPTEHGRRTICNSLKQFLRVPFEVIHHAAGVRPIVQGRHPVVGLDARHPVMGCFNGLASKGALQAPWVAAQFANHLWHGLPLDPAIDIRSRWKVPR